MQQEIKSNSNRESHTRGPWKLHAGTKTFHIAARDYYVSETKTDTIEDEANARLIAAAPDLLSALNIAREYVAASHGVLKHAMGPDNLVKPDLDLIDSAITKAEGK